MLSSVLAFSQKTSLLKNFNYRAKELKHDLNKDGDTLLLESSQTIYQVEIYNSFYEKKMSVNRYKTMIPINDLPEGKYIVEAVLSDRRIIMTIIRHVTAKEALLLNVEDVAMTEVGIESETIPNEALASFEIKNDETVPEEIVEKVIIEDTKEVETIAEVETEALDKEEIVSERGNTRYHHNPAALLNTRILNKTEFEEKDFWVELKTNNGTSSYTTRKLVKGKLIQRLITKNKADVRSARGRQNKLTIWEVYDTSKFMKEQFLDRYYAHNTKTSDCFNHTPYYTTPISKTSR